MSTDSLLVMKGITKYYPGVVALKDVDFDLRRGEIHALLGENGAGKSTLIKILSGCIKRDAGDVILNGTSIKDLDPRLSEDMGIGVIYQEFNLIPYLTVLENLFLGKEVLKYGFRDVSFMQKKAKKVFDMMGVELNLKEQVMNLSIAQQQLVEIAKSLLKEVKVLIMDEPSAPLTDIEIKKMYNIMRTLKRQGVGIIYVSHRLEEIFEITDRVTVFRDGRYIKTMDTSETSQEELIKLMVGREIHGYYPKADYEAGEEVLRVENLTNKKVKDVSFSVRSREILGIAGLVGAGRTETVRAIFGADPILSGKVFIHGKEIRLLSPAKTIKEGIALIPEDRKQQGLLLNLDVRNNISFAILKGLSKWGIIKKKREDKLIGAQIKDLQIKCVNDKQLVSNLSGGNQQKVSLAKWLATKSDVLIIDEPTRGVDVGAKHEIYEHLRNLAKSGKAIIMISSDLPELMNVSDRIIVMREGVIKGELMASQCTQESILNLACLQ